MFVFAICIRRLEICIEYYYKAYLIAPIKMDQEVLDARAKLAAKFANNTQIGGKGTCPHHSSLVLLTK